MKKLLRSLVVLLLLSAIIEAKEVGFTLSTSLVGMSMDYREYDQSETLLDSEKSTFFELVGSQVAATYGIEESPYILSEFSAQALLLSGKTEYVGAAYDSSTQKFGSYGSYRGKTYNMIFDIDLAYSRVHRSDVGLFLGYGMGLGYRSWRRELSANQIELYSWFSLRPKMEFGYSIAKLSLAIKGEYQYGINPQMSILANSENPYTTLDLGSADIVELSIPLRYRLFSNLELHLEYSYQLQTIEKSNSAEYILDGQKELIYEPASSANNQYLKVGVDIVF